MKKIKLLILLSSFFVVYFIYHNFNKNNLYYINLGDNLSVGENSYGAITYSYGDYFKDQLKSNNILERYNKKYACKDLTIKELYYKIKLNSDIKRDLREADILTLSIGLNDIIYEYNINNKYLDEYQEKRIINKIMDSYNKLIKEIKKYYTGRIYFVGYYCRNNIYDNLINKYNYEVKKVLINSDDKYIDINFLTNKNIFDNPNSYYPNTFGYKLISNKIIEKCKNTCKN